MAVGIMVKALARELGIDSRLILTRCREEGLGGKVPHEFTVLSIGLSETVREWFRNEQFEPETLPRIDFKDNLDAAKRAPLRSPRVERAKIYPDSPRLHKDARQVAASPRTGSRSQPPFQIPPLARNVNPPPLNGNVRSKPRPCFIVDGLNIIRETGLRKAQLERLLSLLVVLTQKGYDFICIMDANVRHVLREGQSELASRTYEWLRDAFPDHFIECTGGTRADPVILREASDRNAIVISNDRYRDYEDEYGWVVDETRIWKFNVVRDHMHIHTMKISIHKSLTDLNCMLCIALGQTD